MEAATGKKYMPDVCTVRNIYLIMTFPETKQVIVQSQTPPTYESAKLNKEHSIKSTIKGKTDLKKKNVVKT